MCYDYRNYYCKEWLAWLLERVVSRADNRRVCLNLSKVVFEVKGSSPYSEPAPEIMSSLTNLLSLTDVEELTDAVIGRSLSAFSNRTQVQREFTETSGTTFDDVFFGDARVGKGLPLLKLVLQWRLLRIGLDAVGIDEVMREYEHAFVQVTVDVPGGFDFDISGSANAFTDIEPVRAAVSAYLSSINPFTPGNVNALKLDSCYHAPNYRS